MGVGIPHIRHLETEGRAVNLFRLTQLDDQALEQTSRRHNLGHVHAGVDLAVTHYLNMASQTLSTLKGNRLRMSTKKRQLIITVFT